MLDEYVSPDPSAAQPDRCDCCETCCPPEACALLDETRRCDG